MSEDARIIDYPQRATRLNLEPGRLFFDELLADAEALASKRPHNTAPDLPAWYHNLVPVRQRLQGPGAALNLK